MLLSRLSHTGSRMLMANVRLFSAAANAAETQQACKECTPLERKARRDAAKKSRLQEKEQLRALDEEATKSGLEKPWIYRLSLIVERQPIVMGQPPEWYTAFEEVREKRRQDHILPPINKLVDSILNSKEESIVTEDKDAIEMKKMREATVSDITPADRANDRSSLLRNTPGFLYLLLKQKSGWTFPSIEYDAEEFKNTRQALEHLAARTYGKDLQLYFWGYPPCLCIPRKYSPEEQKKTKAFGEKVFYYRAARLIGDVNLIPSAGKEYNWATLKEFPEYFKDENLLRYFNRVLE